MAIFSSLCCPIFAVSQSDEQLKLSPESRLLLLDHIFLRFDELVKEAGAIKIETVGDVYLVAANVAGVAVPDHALVLSRPGLKFVAAVHEIEAAFRAEVEGFSDSALQLEARVGINSGPLIGGVIGKLLPRYRIFGDTVGGGDHSRTVSAKGPRNCIAPSSASRSPALPHLRRHGEHGRAHGDPRRARRGHPF